MNYPAEEVAEEQRRLRRLQFLVDLTTNVLYQDVTMSLEEAYELVRTTERAILQMFPDKQSTFDLLLRPRFDRIIRERWLAGDSSHTTIH